MLLSCEYQIWEAAEDERCSIARPVIQHVLVERVEAEQGLIVAADGFIMAVVPVILTSDDVPGLLRASALKALVKGAYKGSGSVEIALGAQEASIPGMSLKRFVDDYYDPALNEKPPAFPGWRKIAAELEKPRGRHALLKLNPKFLLKLSKALGTSPIGLAIQPGRKIDKPYLVTTAQRTDLTPPYGAQMGVVTAGATPKGSSLKEKIAASDAAAAAETVTLSIAQVA